jgi:hypothetical protein
MSNWVLKKKARTSGHIFVLKTLIDKYINRKGGKLFACFINLRKAFDTVIHAGIRYKLIKYGISGKLYSIIKDMYRKSELQGRIQGGAHPARPPLKLEKNMIFWHKIVIFHTKYPKNVRAALRSVQFFLSAPP